MWDVKQNVCVCVCVCLCVKVYGMVWECVLCMDSLWSRLLPCYTLGSLPLVLIHLNKHTDRDTHITQHI